jgi:hypothetical protein
MPPTNAFTITSSVNCFQFSFRPSFISIRCSLIFDCDHHEWASSIFLTQFANHSGA